MEERAAAYSTAVVEHARRGAARAVERLWGSFNAQRDARGQPLVPDRSMVTAVVHMYGHRGCLDVANDLLMQYLSVCQARERREGQGADRRLGNNSSVWSYCLRLEPALRPRRHAASSQAPDLSTPS